MALSFSNIATCLGLLSLAGWLYLLAFRGQFWRTRERLRSGYPVPAVWPDVAVIIPARDEAAVIGEALRSLFAQTYQGKFRVVLVDDHSTDSTAAVASEEANRSGNTARLGILTAPPLQSGWSGKIAAQQAGITYAMEKLPDCSWYLLTDADIAHGRDVLERLMAKALDEKRHLVSLMVKLRANGCMARLLIPAFVFFFQKLYPFSWVNNPRRPLAAAAGGTMLVRRDTLEKIGGLASIRHELIDDCALARRIKQGEEDLRPIWLGLSRESISLRPYPGIADVWDMVARTAYTELDHSPMKLLGTLVGMFLLYLVPPFLALSVIAHGWSLSSLLGFFAWMLMFLAFTPMIIFYRQPFFVGLLLPFAGLLYSAMTFDSALRHWRGRGGGWKGRTYAFEKKENGES